jgi:hypothetical protein
MKPKLILCLALVLSGGLYVSTITFAVDPKEFTPDKIHTHPTGFLKKCWNNLFSPATRRG